MRKFVRDNIYFVLTHKVQNLLLEYIQDSKVKNEAGGILLGQFVEDHYYLMRVSEPSQFDKASRYSFERNREVAQIIADYEFVNSNKKTIYIGEWHTHPEEHPSPSKTDIIMIKDQFKFGKNLPSVIFLIILGQSSLYVGLYNGKKLLKMDEI